tara:strand:+ start:17003 stop:19279 length:2277 start_codon:yes stop_codon:yes gene_type:complete
MSSVACSNGLQFEANKVLEKGQSDICIQNDPPDDGAYQAPPLQVEVGDVLNLDYPSVANAWFIQLPDNSMQRVDGPGTFTVTQVGVHKGKLEAVDECNEIKVLYFQFTAYLPVRADSLVINDGEEYTNSLQVSLELNAENATQMYITEDSSCESGGQWQAYKPRMGYTLQNANTNAKVYAKFRGGGLQDSACISDTIIHDDIAPALSIADAPERLNNQTSANFALQVGENGSGLEALFCQLDNNEVQVCSNLINYRELAQGMHRFAAKARDKAGNESDWLLFNWRIDRSKPVLALQKKPSNPSNQKEAEFIIQASDTGSSIAWIECNLNGDGFERCESNYKTNALEGDNQVLFRAADLAGNVSDELSYEWLVDISAPEIRWLAGPSNPTKWEQTDFQFEVKDAGVGVASITCQLDDQQPFACKDTASFFLSDGDYRFRITASDSFGQTNTVEYTWTINTKTQSEVITTPVGVNNHRDILFIMDSSDSMDTEMSHFHKEFKGLISKWGDIDWTIRVASAYAEDYGQGSMGTLAPIHGAKEGTYVLDRSFGSQSQIERALVDTFHDLKRRYRFVEPIHNTYLTVKNLLENKELRENSHLDIVVFTDTDEKLKEEKTIENEPQFFVDYMAENHPKRSYQVHSFSVRPIFEDRRCRRIESHQNNGYAIYDLSKLSGGFAASICGRWMLYGDTYAETLAQLGESRIPESMQIALKCEPDFGKIEVKYLDPVVPETTNKLEGKSLVIHPYPSEGTRIELTYRCP